MARDCATPKGKGKSSNGKGDYGKGDYGKGPYGKGQYKGYEPKGYGKGNFKGAETKGKGKGKGFQGSCWTCGKFGHSSNNCRGISEVQEQPSEDLESMEIGGVWDICKIKQTTPVRNMKGWPKIASKNKFGDLEDSDDEEDREEDEMKIEPPPGLLKRGFEKIQRKR